MLLCSLGFYYLFKCEFKRLKHSASCQDELSVCNGSFRCYFSLVHINVVVFSVYVFLEDVQYVLSQVQMFGDRN